jgi:DNA-directed RNA polymerase subunit RPC12/RpoP
MGELKKLICPKCGHTVKFYEGVGMLWYFIDKNAFYPPKNSTDINFYKELDKKMLEEIHNFLKESEDVSVEAGYQPYICKKCGKIVTKIDFTIGSGNKIYTPAYTCNCGNEYAKLTEEEQQHVLCKECGSEMMCELTGFWD